MRFYAFNPLAGGILTGKYRFDEAATTGRYAKGTVMGDRYRCGGLLCCWPVEANMLRTVFARPVNWQDFTTST